MRLAGEVQQFSVMGPDHEANQDVLLHRTAANGAEFLAGFDGHGVNGARIAQFGARAVELVSEVDYGRSGHEYAMSRHIGDMVNGLSDSLRKMKRGVDFSGAVGTAAVAHSGRIELVYLGDTSAFWIPLIGSAVRLTEPHDRSNEDERRRVAKEGGVEKFVSKDGMGRYLFWDPSLEKGLEPSRAIGHFGLRFISHETDLITYDPTGPGIFLIATDGMLNGTEISTELVNDIRNGTVDEAYVKEMANKNGDDASILIAPFSI